MKNYYKKREEFVLKMKQYHIKNRDKIIKRHEDLCFKKKKGWVGIIPEETNCEICGKKLYFFGKTKKETIHFDHKKMDVPIKQSPGIWLRAKALTPEREKMWRDSDFGLLCDGCNKSLPTNDRENFVRKVVKYIFGQDKEIR